MSALPPIHVIDFEGSPRSGVVEYGVATLENGCISTTHTRLCAPTGTIDAAAFAQHGIRTELAQAEPPFSEAWELFKTLRQSGCLCAHHASVEHGFLRTQWPYPAQSPDFFNPKRSTATWEPWLDTRRLAENAWPTLENFQLGTLVDALHLRPTLDELAQKHCPPTRRKAHCALYDALASALILQHLLKSPHWADAPLPVLLHASSSAARSREQLSQGDFFS